MALIPAHTARQLRNASMSALYRVAYDHDVDLADVMASITPSQPPQSSQAPAARTYPPVPVAVHAGETPSSSADHSDACPHDPDGQHFIGCGCDGIDDEPIPEAPKPLPDEEHRPAEAKTSDQGALSSEPGGMQDESAIHPATPSKPARGRPATTRAKIVAVHAEHPEWPSKLIAEHLGIGEDTVRACASRKGLKLVSWWDYQRTLPPEQRTVPAKPASAVPSNRDRVREAHTAHPDFTAKELAFHLGMDELNLRAVASQIGLKLPKAKVITPPTRVTLADKIRAHLVDHPDATARELSDALGVKLTSIGWAAQKAGITLRKRTTEERSEASRRSAKPRQPKLQEPVERAGPPTPRAEPKQPPVSTAAEPFDDDEPAPRVRKVNRAPTGRFYLRDKDGRYVHQSLQATPIGSGPMMTIDRKWAWFDTMDRYRGAKKLWPELADMRKEAASV